MNEHLQILLSPPERTVIDILSDRRPDVLSEVLENRQDRQRFVHTCKTHAVQQLVAGLLRQSLPSLPDSVGGLIAELEAGSDERTALLLAAGAQLYKLAEMLDARGVPFCLLKGIALVNTVYRETPLWRPFGDVDILAPEAYFDQVISIFLGLGYKLAAHKQDVQAIRKYGHKLCFLPPARGMYDMDVHFRPIGKKLFERTARLDTDLFWVYSSSCRIEGRQFTVPALELHLLYLCVHLSLQHHLASLGWLYDIKKFTSCREFDWDSLVRLARTCRVERAVWLSLKAAQDMLSADVPSDVVSALSPRNPGTATNIWFASLLDRSNIMARVHHYRQKRLLGKVSRMFQEVLLIDRRGDRWRGVLRWLLPDPMFFRTSYGIKGAWRIFLCYLIHPLVVIGMAIAVGLLTVKYARERHRYDERATE